TGVLDEAEEMKDADYPQIRFFHVQQALSPFEELDDCKGEWKIVSPENIKDCSAIAFFFGREVFKGIRQPIGLIQSTWGGTHAESWTKMAYMKGNTLYKTLLENQQATFDRYPADSLTYVKALADYEAKKKESDSLTAPKKPQHPSNNKTLATLWNAMIHPLVPYTIKGVIWYQGESNNIRAADYTNVFSNMITSWRNEWQQGEFPFYFVQIAPHYKQDPEIRDAQLDTWRSIRNTGMVVITDVGDSTDIHPRNKRIPGDRLAYWALAKDYGQDITFSGPLFKSVAYDGQFAVVSFDYAGSELHAKGGVLKGFEIAAKDGVFYPADARIKGDKVVLCAGAVHEPRYVRYGWGKFFRVNLYNKEGLPASPFRSSIAH
ncbi:MAG TPA: sialate O-acetylesterase, partial [Sphingobacterium sp.]|nr:sialate O-acetylesterase [Sphingobacterium sp.]